jgi:NAD+ synthase (glutamine-hydrolysing)
VIRFELTLARGRSCRWRAVIERFPYVPSDRARRDERCTEVYHIQVQALVQRLAASGVKKVVIGISGGLDSTHALLVCAKAMDQLGLPRSEHPGLHHAGLRYQRTHAAPGAAADGSGRLHRAGARHPPELPPDAQGYRPSLRGGEQVYDITFENVQAGERTSHLFRLANLHNGIVVGTGDLSELALGWCTYGVGDHMSHYNVNASVPKTLISHLVRWVAETGAIGATGSQVLHDVLDTEISPELVPGGSADGKPAQSTEDTIGPYELQDFSLYYILRYGFAPSKVAFLAQAAWRDREAGAWPDEGVPKRNEYALADIKRHLRSFVWRFFKTSQFKRSCVPNGPKVGNGGSLSPRGDWRAPSDSEATVWLKDLDKIPD